MATKQHTYFYGLGRRKRATARARLMSGKGAVTINGKVADDYLDNNSSFLAELTDPLALAGIQKKYDVSIVVRGGGVSGQIDASKLAIAKAIGAMNEDMRGSLKKAGLLKRDSRVKERKKYGLRKARKREQYSKR